MITNQKQELYHKFEEILKEVILEMQEKGELPKDLNNLNEFISAKKKDARADCSEGKNAVVQNPSGEIFKTHKTLSVILCPKLNITKKQYFLVLKLLERLELCRINNKGAYLSRKVLSKL